MKNTQRVDHGINFYRSVTMLTNSTAKIASARRPVVAAAVAERPPVWRRRFSTAAGLGVTWPSHRQDRPIPGLSYCMDASSGNDVAALRR